jgi:hypothetical protein
VSSVAIVDDSVDCNATCHERRNEWVKEVCDCTELPRGGKRVKRLTEGDVSMVMASAGTIDGRWGEKLEFVLLTAA